MTEEKVTIYELKGGEVNILKAEKESVKLNKTGMFLCKEGEVTLTIDNKEYRLYKNSIVVYFSYSNLRIINHSDNLRGTLIGVNLETIQPLLYNVTNFNSLYIIKQSPHYILSDTQYNIIGQYITLLKAASKKDKSTLEDTNKKEESPVQEIAKKQVELLSYALILEILQCYASTLDKNNTFSRKDDVLHLFVTQLYKKYRTEHKVTYYANLQCLTTRYFSTVIKEKSGKTPSEWITTALLVDTRNLLKKTNMTIKEISDTLNFPNQSYFGKWFKKLTSLSPLDYRNGKKPKEPVDYNFTDIVQRGMNQTNNIL